MHQSIASELGAIEQNHNVKVLFASESGSRAWGFASPDSDYDVRFVYVNSADWYLTVYPQRDVIEVPISGELDINGWDLRKALGLLHSSNPTLLEWLQSPIQYLKTESVDELTMLAKKFFSPVRGYHHYFSMAKKNFRGYLQGDVVRFKKYFYVLRPLLAAQWVREGRGVPPMRFAKLAESLIPEGFLADEINELLKIKMRSGEGASSARWPRIHDYITETLQANENAMLPSLRSDSAQLDDFFRRTVRSRGEQS